MSEHLLIVAGDAAARASSEVARSLQFTPVVARSEEEAMRLLDQQPFSVIAVMGDDAGRRLRDLAAAKQPAARVFELPESNGEDTAVRRVTLHHLRSSTAAPHFSIEERYRLLST